MTLEPGDVLADRYRILRRLGRGGMAEVFAADDRKLGRQVAIKVPAEHLLDDPDALRRFRREARAAAALNHPHLVGLHDIVSDSEVHFLVMELVAGPTLADRLSNQGPLAVEEALEVAGQLADALAAAHDRGLVHRDVKPSNVLFDADGSAKIADFGIAGAVEASTTMTAVVRGSVPYIAPEQAGGDPPDPRSDLYALGCVLFEMLTGQPPFSGETSAAVLAQHLHREPPPASSMRPAVPERLDAVVGRLLVKDPADRYPDATAVREDLFRVSVGEDPSTATLALAGAPHGSTAVLHPDGHGVAAESVSEGVAGVSEGAAPGRRLRSRRRWAWGAGAVLVVAVLGWLMVDDSRQEPAPRAAGIPTATATPTPTRAASPTPTVGPRRANTSAGSELPPAQQAATDVRQLLAQGREQGHASAKAVDEIEKRLAEVLKQHREGKKPGKVRKKIEELSKKVGDLAEEGEINPGLAVRLGREIDGLEQAIT